MFKKSPFKKYQVIILSLFAMALFSCVEDIQLNFSETTILSENESIVEVNIPKAEGDSETANRINRTLEDFVNTSLNIDASKKAKGTIEENISQFNTSYKSFKKQISEELSQELPIWEAVVEGEVIYKNEAVVSISMNSSINTGGAHGNMIIRFFNFDTGDGRVLQKSDLLLNEIEFTKLAEKYYNKELLTAYNGKQLTFKDDIFTLPETLGFSDEGVILFYESFFNSETKEIVEFTIPYAVANKYLKI